MGDKKINIIKTFVSKEVFEISCSYYDALTKRCAFGNEIKIECLAYPQSCSTIKEIIHMSILNVKLKNARKNKGLTLEALANMVGSSKSYMWQLENDETIKPSVQLISRIADALNVTVDFLIDLEKGENDYKEEAMVFYRNFQELDDDSKKMILQQIKHLKKLQKGN